MHPSIHLSAKLQNLSKQQFSFKHKMNHVSIFADSSFKIQRILHCGEIKLFKYKWYKDNLVKNFLHELFCINVADHKQ